MLSAVTAALMTIVGKIGLKNIDSTLATGIRSLIMFVFMISVVIFTGKLKGINTIDQKSFLVITLSAIFGALSWIFYFVALRYAPASKVSAIDRLSLIFVILLSLAFLGEKLNFKLAIGSILATAGIIFITLA